jgi:anti-sigma factor RsiW
MDGDLDLEDRALLESHLEGCPKCRKEMASLTQTIDWLEGLRPVQPPSGFDDLVLRRVRLEREEARRRLTGRDLVGAAFRRWMRPAAAAAALLAIAVFAGPALVSISSSFVTTHLADPLARVTVRLVEVASDPKEIEAISDQAKAVSSPIGLVGRSVYSGLLDLVVPIALWCAIGIACLGLVWWISRYGIQRRTRDASFVT